MDYRNIKSLGVILNPKTFWKIHGHERLENSGRLRGKRQRKIVTEVTMRNQTRIDRMCYLKVPKPTGGKAIQTVAFNSFTCRAPRLFNRMPLEIREIRRLPQLSATANILRFKSRLDKYLSCVPDLPLINGYPHCSDNSLLNRVAKPGSDWRMWQQHASADAAARVENVPTAMGQVAATL